MKKLFTLLTLLVTIVTGAWAQTETATIDFGSAIYANLVDIAFSHSDKTTGSLVDATLGNHETKAYSSAYSIKGASTTFTSKASYNGITGISLYASTTDKGKTYLKVEICPNADFSSGVTTVQAEAVMNGGGLPTNMGNNNQYYQQVYAVSNVTGYVRVTVSEASGSSGKTINVGDIAITYSASATAPSTPTFSPATNSSIDGASNVTITSEGASTIYYAWTETEGEPSTWESTAAANSAATVVAPNVNGTRYLYAKGSNSNGDSDVAHAAYTITKQVLDANLSYTTTEYSIYSTETFTAPTVNNPNSLTGITYSLTGDAGVASVDENSGAVTLLGGLGTVTITASSPAQGDYAAGSAFYTLTVEEKQTLTTVTSYTWNFSDTQKWGNFGTVSKATINDNLEVLADASSTASISSNSVTIDGTQYSKAFSFGQVKDGSRQLHIKVAGNTKITLYLKAGGSGRKIKVTKDSKDGEVVGTEQEVSSTAAAYTFEYTGSADADLYMFNSGSSSLNFYGVKVESLISDPVFTITPTELEVGGTATISGPDGLAYTATVKSGNAVSISGATITAEQVGTAVVNITSAATSTYNAYDQDFNITVTGVKTETTMAFDNPTTNVELNGTVQNVATLTGGPEGATITYASSDETVATVAADGTVTGKKIGGTATITASYAGNDEYKASEASYEISVVAPALVAVDDYVWNGNDWLTYFNIPSKGSLDIASTTWVDNLELVATSDEKITIKDNNSTSQTTPDFAEGFKVRVRTNGESTTDARYVHFIVKPNTKITAYAIRNSNDGGVFALATGTRNNEVATHTFTDGGGIETIDYIYTGSENTDVFVYAKTTGAQFVAFRVAPLAEVTITSAGAASFSSTEAIDFAGSDVTAYQATAKSDNYVHLEEITKLPAGAGAIIKAPAGTYKVAIANCETPELTDNLLVGTGEGTFTVGNDYGKIYKYAKRSSDGLVGFQKAKSDWTCQAGKAYLRLLDTNARDFIAIFGEDTTTAIDKVETASVDVNAPMFNLAGQRVSKNYKGIVIVNGKKVVK